jgi:hypothetical protein
MLAEPFSAIPKSENNCKYNPSQRKCFYAYTEGKFGQFTLIFLIFCGKLGIAYIFPNYRLPHTRETIQI